jgi:two-component system, chemotaxis family, chemotaxis protein CheY
VLFLVVESSLSVRESLCFVLLSFGVRGIPVPDRPGAMDALKKGDTIDGAIIDIDNKSVDGVQLINDLKGSEHTRGMSIIVHTVQSSKELVMSMVDLGVAGYLLKPFKPETAKSKLAVIFSKLSTHNSQRRHIRVKPDPDEMVRVSFRIPNESHLVSGRIVDISLGGMAVELFNPPATEIFSSGIMLSQMKFALSGKEISPQASVVLFKSKVLAVRFDSLSPSDKQSLERYIFKSISS